MSHATQHTFRKEVTSRQPATTCRFSKSILALALALTFGPVFPAAAIDFEVANYQTDKITEDNLSQLTGEVSVNHFKKEEAANRTLTIEGNGLQSSRANVIAAGYAYTGNSVSADCTNNTLLINGTFLGTALYGGYSSKGNATGNTVRITNSDVGDSKMSSITGGYAGSTGEASNNSVIVTQGSTVTTESRAVVGGNSYNGNANNNTVTIEKDATVTATVKGAIAGYNATQSASSEANGNTVTIESGATVTGTVTGAETYGSAQGNTVRISGTVTGNVTGVTTYASSSSQAQVSDTLVELDGAYISGNVTLLQNGNASMYGDGNEIRLTNSTVTGIVRANSGSKTLSKMTLTGVNTVGRLEYVGELVLNVTEANVDEAVLTWTQGTEDKGYVGTNLDLRGTTLVISGADTLDSEGSYKLIDNNGLGIIYYDSTTVIEKRGVFVDNLWETDLEDGETVQLTDGIQIVNGDLTSGDQLIAVGKEAVNDNSKTLAESFLGSLAFVNQGSEFIADEGLRIMNAVASDVGLKAFGAIHGGSSRYETGSHIDVNGVTLATGLTSRFGNGMVALFVEAGLATSESHVSGTTGDGDHSYYGLGVAGRYSFESPLYIEGSARLGWASTEFDGRYADAAAEYDSDSFYGSMHLALGFERELTESMKLDLYGRYTLTYLEGDTIGIKGVDGTTFDMDDVTTHAFRVGARLTGQINEVADWRVGLAYEHVFDGDAQSSVIEKTRLALETPTLEGDTGIVEVGFTMKPSAASPWSVDFGVKGYVGDRKGVSASGVVTYAF